MFDKIKEKMLRKIAEKAYPGRKINVSKIGKRYFITCMDELGKRNDYKLKGTYNYKQVMALNDLTGHFASFGFCEGIGPVAFIGIPNPACINNSGYFRYNVHEYGTPLNDEKCYFECYSEEDAEHIGNYTVFGMHDPRVLDDAASIDKLDYIYDFRYKSKDASVDNLVHNVLRMDAMLEGTYSFNEARKIAYGSTKKPDGYCGGQMPLQFAIVNDEPVGILNLWPQHEDKKFKDVWEISQEEPEEEPIHFISDEEACEINKFKLYIYQLPYSFDQSKYNLEKTDRTLDRRFNFVMEDGTDYRLQTLGPKAKVLSKIKK